MSNAIARIVVQATPEEKSRLVAKARKLAIPVAELMRRGADAYQASGDQSDLDALAVEAKAAADRSIAAIDDAVAFIAESNRQIALMEAEAAQVRAAAGGR